MARITFEEYQKFEQQRAGGDTRKQQTAGVRYFSLAEDGDSAIVRFNIKGINDLIIEGVHRVKTSDGKTRTVSCLTNRLNIAHSAPMVKIRNIAFFFQ